MGRLHCRCSPSSISRRPTACCRRSSRPADRKDEMFSRSDHPSSLSARKTVRREPFSRRCIFSSLRGADSVQLEASSLSFVSLQVPYPSPQSRRPAPPASRYTSSFLLSLALLRPGYSASCPLRNKLWLSSEIRGCCRIPAFARSFASLGSRCVIEEPETQDSRPRQTESRQESDNVSEPEVLSSRLFSPFDSRLKSPLQASASQIYKRHTSLWSKGGGEGGGSPSNFFSTGQPSCPPPSCWSSSPQPVEGTVSSPSSFSSLSSTSSSSTLFSPSSPCSAPPLPEDHQGGDILRREALWWVRHTRQVTVDVVDNWTLSFHFLYKQKQFEVLKEALEDSLHVVPCLRPGEIAMLANHASRLLPLRKGGGGAGSSKRGAGLAHSETEGAMEERRIRRWWALFGDSLSHLLHDADGRDISIILNAFSAARVFHHENLMKLLAREVAAWAPHNSVRNTALILNAMARLKVTDEEAVEGSCLLVQKEATNLNHIDCAMSINAAARLGYRDASFYSVVGDAAVRQLRRMNEHNLSMILWAYGTVGVRHHALLGEAIDQLLRISHSRLVHANYVAPILGAFGSLQFEHPRLAVLIEVLVKPNVERFEPVDNVLVCTALSRLGCRVTKTPLAAQLLAMGGRLIANGVLRDRPHHALNLAVAAGAMEATGMKSFWDDISGGMAAALKMASSSEISGAMLPVAKVKGYPAWRPSLLKIATEAMAAHGPARWSPRDVSNFLFVLGKTDGEIGEDVPAVGGRGSQGALECHQTGSERMLPPPGHGAEGRSSLSPALARRQLVKDMCAYSARQMSRFNPYDVVRLLQACAVLNYRDEGVLNAVGHHLREAEAAGACDAFPFHVQRSIAAALLKLEAPHVCSREWLEGLRCHEAAMPGRPGDSRDRFFSVEEI